MKRLFMALSLMAVCIVATAVPAKRGQWKTVKTADGREIKVERRGDEFCRYWQSENGVNYVRNVKTGLFEKADLDSLTRLSAQKRLPAAARQAQRARKARANTSSGETLYTGKKKGLIVLVEFADMAFSDGHTPELFQRIANEEGFSEMGFNGSVKDYFKSQSYGTFELDFDIAGPVVMPECYAYYGGNTLNGDDPWPRIAKMVIDVCTAIDDTIDFSQYDWDGDGEIDQVFILYAGHGEASYRDPDTIWPHEWDLYSALYPNYQNSPIMLDGVMLNTYACSCELGSGETIDGIGTICHEFSHCLGLPDMYDTQYGGNYGLDGWSLMDNGAYCNNGMTPPNFTSYERMAAGWLQPEELDKDTLVSCMTAIGDEPKAFAIYNDGDRNEFYLLENRQQTGWDAYIPSSGMIILHVDYDEEVWYYNVVNSARGQRSYGFNNAHERCKIIQADKGLPVNSPAGDAWPNSTHVSLTKETIPAASVYNANTDGSYYMNKSVTDITDNGDGTMAFAFSIDETTGISHIQAKGNESSADKRIYSLDGRFIGNDENSLKKGIYIINGKKVVK